MLQDCTVGQFLLGIVCICYLITYPHGNGYISYPTEKEEENHDLPATFKWEMWVFPKIGLPQNGRFITENPY